MPDSRRLAALCLALTLPLIARAEPPKPSYGHSMQGEAFNEGPRQRAVLMPGMARIVFPVTTRKGDARRFIEQGIGQLHAYWYFEAERSFRQAARIDPKCAIAYWGMAWANINNETRAKGFIAAARERRAGVSEREQMWIDSADAFFNPPKDGKDRHAAYADALQKLAQRFPDDLEAKAFLIHEKLELHYNQPGRGNPEKRPDAIAAAKEIDALIEEVLAKNPDHPIHHYRIHLWDFGDSRPGALAAAARCGLSEPGIAHMWHMCGHTYSGLKRYHDAVYYQEASARVDHAHMIRARILPDQIHNYAHNNQWLAENLIYVGRAHDALRVAGNLMDLPRHPAYNVLGSGGSADMGRMRATQALFTYELWPQALALDARGEFDSPRIAQRMDRLALLACAAFETGDLTRGRAWRAELMGLVSPVGPKPAGLDMDDWKDSVAEVRVREALVAGDTAGAAALMPSMSHADALVRAPLWRRIGRLDEAEKDARQAVAARPQQTVPLAHLVRILWEAGKKDEARKAFDELRTVGGEADLDTPVIAPLAPIARALGYPSDWRIAPTPGPDTGKRPPLASLGPLAWSPAPAPDPGVRDSRGRLQKLLRLRPEGKPMLAILYLGSGCEKCMAQLGAFAPLAADFEKAGIAVRAFTPEQGADLFEHPNPAIRGVPFPIFSDASLSAFKALRAYDDFEEMPLHGVFLIDAQGKIRWQDISFQAFADAAFVLEESRRLLALPATEEPRAEAR